MRSSIRRSINGSRGAFISYPKFKKTWIVALLCLVALSDTAYAKGSTFRSVELHSDNSTLTSNFNDGINNFSASVDTVRLVLNRLGWHKDIVQVPLIRSLHSMDNGESVCVVNKIKTPKREDIYDFSLPINFFRPHKLYQNASLPPIDSRHLDDKGAVISIHQIINQQPDSIIIVPDNFSFGQLIDTDLSKINKSQTIPINNESYYHLFLKMFANYRSDYAVIFPLALYKTYGDTVPFNVRSYEIANHSKMITGHFFCSRTPQTKAFIKRVDEAMSELYSDDDYVTAHTRYLPQRSQPVLQNMISDFDSTINSH